MEILLLSGNGYGVGAERLLRGLYERAVTARYIADHPEKATDFVDFGKINLFKMLEPIRQTHGEGLIPAERVRELKAFHADFKRRGRTPKGLVERALRLYRRIRGFRERMRSTSRWTDDLSFEAMAKKTSNLGRILLYCWHWPTLQVHASFQNITERLRVIEERELEFDGGPTRATADRALNFAMLVMLDVLDLQRTYFGISALDPLLKQCESDYLAVWHPERVSPDVHTDEHTR